MGTPTQMREQWIDEIKDPNALMVVAHPDDETIFAGGLILSFNANWTIVCCIHEQEERRSEFHCACDFLSEQSGNLIKSEYLGFSSAQAVQMLPEKLLDYRDDFDIVFTHNSMGEYGHEHHKLVHHMVVANIFHENTWLFISPGSWNVNQDVLRSKNEDGNRILKIKPEILELKIRTFHECHKSQAMTYGYDPKTKKLRETQLKDTLKWEFESGLEEYTFFK